MWHMDTCLICCGLLHWLCLSCVALQLVTLQEAKLLLKEDDELIKEVFDYWSRKRKTCKGGSLIPNVKQEKRDGSSTSDPYVAFRRRTEKMQTRKVGMCSNLKKGCCVSVAWKCWLFGGQSSRRIVLYLKGIGVVLTHCRTGYTVLNTTTTTTNITFKSKF